MVSFCLKACCFCRGFLDPPKAVHFYNGIVDLSVEDGAFHFQLRLGETRCERFYVALDKKVARRIDRSVSQFSGERRQAEFNEHC